MFPWFQRPKSPYVLISVSTLSQIVAGLREAATKNDLKHAVDKIMSAIKTYVDAVNASFDTIDKSFDGVNNGIIGLVDDVKYLKETIDKLQSTPGALTPEDEKLLGDLQTRANSASTKGEGIRVALAALDEATTRPTPPQLAANGGPNLLTPPPPGSNPQV